MKKENKLTSDSLLELGEYSIDTSGEKIELVQPYSHTKPGLDLPECSIKEDSDSISACDIETKLSKIKILKKKEKSDSIVWGIISFIEISIVILGIIVNFNGIEFEWSNILANVINSAAGVYALNSYRKTKKNLRVLEAAEKELRNVKIDTRQEAKEKAEKQKDNVLSRSTVLNVLKEERNKLTEPSSTDFKEKMEQVKRVPLQKKQ